MALEMTEGSSFGSGVRLRVKVVVRMVGIEDSNAATSPRRFVRCSKRLQAIFVEYW